MLSGEAIIEEIEKGNIVIKPFDKESVGPNSYSVHIGNELLIYENDVLECKKKSKTRKIIIPEDGYILRPGEKIYPNMKVGELCYFPVVGPENIKYKGKYLGQIDTTASRIYEDEFFKN